MVMSNKLKKKKTTSSQNQQDGVFKEAWENMNEDMSRFVPAFISKRLQKGKSKMWVVIVVTLVEIAVLGIVGKLVYDWFVN